jgi:hypothetical protein
MPGVMPDQPWARSDVQGLLEFSEKLDQQIEFDDVARLTIQAAVRLLQSDAARLSLVDPATGALDLRWDTTGIPLSGAAASVLDAATRQVHQDGKPVRRDAADSYPDTYCLLCMPVVAHNTRLGTLSVVKVQGGFDNAVEQFLKELATKAGSGILRARRFKAFSDITLATVQSSKVQHALESVFRELSERRFEFATISAIDGYRGVIETIRSMNVPPQWVRLARHSLDSTDIQAEVVRQCRSQVISGADPRLDPDIFERFDHIDLARVWVPVSQVADVPCRTVLCARQAQTRHPDPPPDRHRRTALLRSPAVPRLF